jgi:putative spermidine/putrescine transport system permease protein
MSRVTIEPKAFTRWAILGVIGVLFALPIIAMIEFSLRGAPGEITFDHWTGILDPEQSRKYRDLWEGVGNSLVLAVVTVVIVNALLVPTMVLVALQFPKAQRWLEFVCLIPITVPAIVLVVGLAPVYGVVSRIFGGSVWTLAFAYGITVLPYAYRAVRSAMDAVDIVTLSEAARSLGSGWVTVFFRVLVPNIRRGMLAASVITVAVVLGEFTIASLLNRDNLQTSVLLISRSDPYVATIFAMLALLFALILLIVIGRVGAAKPRRRKS